MADSSIARIAPLFFKLRQAIRAKLAKGGARLDPSAWIRIEALRFVDEQAPSMRELAKFLAITAPSATSFTRSLVRAGLVQQRADSRDRRLARLLLTATGKRLLVEAKARQGRALAEIFAPLSRKDLATLERILRLAARE